MVYDTTANVSPPLSIFSYFTFFSPTGIVIYYGYTITYSMKRPTSVLFFQSLVPFYVNATAGTTVYGAFDPLNDIADICHRYNLWMHVDVRFISIC